MRVFYLLLLLCSLTVKAQLTVSGIVKDSRHNTPLAFATIVAQNGEPIIADADGKFTFTGTKKTTWFAVSYTGYKSQRVTIIKNRVYYTILLSEKPEQLTPVEIKYVNPANAIIRQAIQKRSINDPQQKLESFRYKSYDRLIVTANPDSVSSQIDSVYLYEKAGRRLEKIDSSIFKFKKLVEKQHIYQTEKVSEFKYNTQKGLKETVLATRMAGFKQPLYEFIGLKLQSYSVYTDNITVFETRYQGPLADDAFNEYAYKILDTVSINNRMVYVIYFTPKRAKKNKKLEGLLYIDAKNYGVAKAVFRTKNVLNITSTHLFTYVKEYDLWFPDKKSLRIIKGNNKEDIKILGETIKFDAVSNDKNRPKDPSDYIYLISESSNFDKEFNVPVSIRRQHIAVEIGREAINRPEEYWNSFRPDTLDSRSLTTYTALDSLIEKDNWENRIILGRNIINGYLPTGPINLDLRHFIKYNNYEGFRPGVGGITNERFSRIFRISGYGAYGTKDGRFKYSGGAAIRLGNFSNSWIGASYTNDVREIGSTVFAVDKRTFKIYDPRPVNLTTFYNYEAYQAYIETRIIPKTESTWQLTRSRIDPKFGYMFMPDNDNTFSMFKITTATASVQWNPFSDFMQTPTGRIETEKRFPKFTFQYTQSLAGVLGSDFTFGKLDFRADYEKKYLNGQKSMLMVQSGLAGGDTPLTHLYSTSPNSLRKDAILQRVNVAGKNSFETMYFNEFFSSQYIMVQGKHGFRKYTLIDKIKLAPVLVTRLVWGNMENREQHTGIEYNTLEKGYYESGIEFNEIYSGFGFSAFYRYGPYHIPQFDKNIAIKISFVLNLGF